MSTNDIETEYKTILLIGGDYNNIQVVIGKDEKQFEAIVEKTNSWEVQLYKQLVLNEYEFLLQD